MCCVCQSLSRVPLFATPWNVAHQALLSMGFSRQEYWSGLPFPSPRDLPYPGIKPWSPALYTDSLQSEPPWNPVRQSYSWSKTSNCRMRKKKKFHVVPFWEYRHFLPEATSKLYGSGLPKLITKARLWTVSGLYLIPSLLVFRMKGQVHVTRVQEMINTQTKLSFYQQESLSLGKWRSACFVSIALPSLIWIHFTFPNLSSPLASPIPV